MNKKGQTTLIVTITATLVLTLLLGTLAYISSMSLRGEKIMINRQLTELSKGSIFYSMSVIKDDVDFVKFETDGKREVREVDYDGDGDKHTYEVLIKDDYAHTNSTIEEYTDASNPSLYESYYKRTVNEVRGSLAPNQTVEKVIHLNNAQDVCYQVNWSGSSTVQVELRKVVPKATPVNDDITDAVNYTEYPNERDSWVILPVQSTTGQIGQVPASFNNHASSYNVNDCNSSLPDSIPYTVFYDNADDTPPPNYTDEGIDDRTGGIGNGLGPYKIVVKNVGSNTVSNLQLKVLYNRLSYRTYKITSDIKYGNYTKNNISAIVRANYSEDETDITPKIEIIRWIEGAE